MFENSKGGKLCFVLELKWSKVTELVSTQVVQAALRLRSPGEVLREGLARTAHSACGESAED